MGWGILGDAWDAAKGGVEWIGEKAEQGYNVGKKFVEENADTIADVAGVVGDVSAFLATGAALVPGVGTVAAAGLAGLGAAGKGVEALAKGASGVSKAIDAGDAAIDAMRAGDTTAAFKAAKQGIAAGKGVAGAADTVSKPFRKPGKVIEKEQQTKEPKEEDKAKRQALFDEFR
tara:strand:- start:3623 stop:4144 length:522 start_codon:yes stop_codon:yes gene_type:complete